MTDLQHRVEDMRRFFFRHGHKIHLRTCAEVAELLKRHCTTDEARKRLKGGGG